KVDTHKPGKVVVPLGPTRRAQQDPALVRWGLTLAAFVIVGVLIVIPVVHVFVEAFADGLGTYFDALFNDRITCAAIQTTLIVAPAAVLLNSLFGVAAAWAVARFRFPGRTLLVTLIDLPFSVSPVVAGLIFVLFFGLQGYLSWFPEHDYDVIN